MPIFISEQEYQKIEEVRHKEKKAQNFRYGLPVEQIETVAPPSLLDPEFLYGDEVLSSDNTLLAPQLLPNPSKSKPPEGFTYPVAPIYTLRPDKRFRRGYCYSTSVSTAYDDKLAEADHLYHTRTPPGVDPVGYDPVRQTFIMAPVEGMIEMPPGVPFTVLLDNVPDREITVACLHTLQSLSHYGMEFPKIADLTAALWKETFGTKTTPPIWHLGFKPNKRSAAPVEGKADGSYSLAATVGEGQGNGVVQPVSQINSPEATIRLHRLLTCLHQLYRLIVPLCISKQEWEVWNMRSNDLNVVSAGGLLPAFTSCQLNVSSGNSGGSLAEFIGDLQGKWHVDAKDDPNSWTLVIGMLRIPPGSATGDFLHARCGLYARVWPDQNGHVYFFFLFKGNDLHSGTAPKTEPDAWKDFIAKTELDGLYQQVGEENRAVYVLYPSRAAFQRDAGMAMTRRNGFGNEEGVASRVKEKLQSFGDNGFPCLGNWDDMKNRLGWERYMHAYNMARDTGTIPDQTLPTYTNLSDQTVSIHPLPFDPEVDAAWVNYMRGLFRNLHENNLLYLLSMTKSAFKVAQEKGISTLKIAQSASSEHSSTSQKTAAKYMPKSQKALRKRTADDAQLDDDQEEITSIREHRIDTNGEMEYRVRWLGYSEEHDTWISEKELSETASDLLAWYQKSIRFGTSKSQPLPKTLSSNRQSTRLMAQSNPSAVALVEKTPAESGEAPETDLINSISHNLNPSSSSTAFNPTSTCYSSLIKLLDLDNLASENSHVRMVLNMPQKNLNHHTASATDCQELLNLSTQSNSTYSNWTDNNTFIGEDLTKLFDNLHGSLKTAESSSKSSLKTDVLKRSLNLAICRSLRFVSLWYSCWGPSLAHAAFDMYMSDGKDGVARTWTTNLAILVEKIMIWLNDVAACKKAGSIPPRLDLPSDLYGFHKPASDDHQNILVTPPTQKLTKKDIILKKGKEFFLGIISDHVIIPAMQFCDGYINSDRRNNISYDGIKARCVVRGALLDTLVDWLDDDGIFATLDILKVLESPAALFSKKTNEEDLSKRIINKEIHVFAPLESYLWEEHDSADVQDSVVSLSYAVQEAVTRMSKRDIPLRKAGYSFRKKRQSYYTSLEGLPRVSADEPLYDLCPWQYGFRADKLAIILREALLQRAQLPAGNVSLRRIMEGIHPTVSGFSNTRDPDHYDPIRATNHFQRLMEVSLGQNNLHSDYGLSNILIRIGTGQGKMTQDFMSRHLAGVWFTSASDCVRVFEAAWQANPKAKLDNMRCWGTACAWLSFERDTSNARPHFEQRIQPMFENHICILWNQYLSKSPQTYQNALQLSEDTKIAGFGSGITRMQFANTLVLLGLCEMPSIGIMADIIYKNSGMGAFEGLQRLGLDVRPGCSKEQVQKAFYLVHNFLEKHLTPENKQVLHFSPIFVEHMLCKVSRWEKAFRKNDSKTLNDLAIEAWSEDATIFPIPLTTTRKDLLELLK
ncbi:Chromobox protein 5 [Stygiomarasmius scandens]|uniref:Chromobox protein 5 n=1 Tax=Marasmiellus scandens TaxID=2682957 RepID=A0ABR1JK55_9AGAR